MEELKLLALYGSGMLHNIFSNSFFMFVFFLSAHAFVIMPGDMLLYILTFYAYELNVY